MIYDCFTFFNELDLLEIRLNTLNDVVDKFVIVESRLTFNNQEKELFYLNNKARFKAFEKKIIHVIADEYPPFESAWIFENHQRNYILKALESCHSEDTILISDVDEIPKPEVVIQLASSNDINVLEMGMYYYYFNMLNVSDMIWNNGTKILKYKHFLQELPSDGYQYSLYLPKKYNIGTTPNKIRHYTLAKKTQNAGWHFSYLGGIDAIIKKIESFSHQEFNHTKYKSKENLKKAIENGTDIFERGYKYLPIPLDTTFPQHIIENKSRYTLFILPCASSNKIKIKYYLFIKIINKIFRKILSTFKSFNITNKRVLMMEIIDGKISCSNREINTKLIALGDKKVLFILDRDGFAEGELSNLIKQYFEDFKLTEKNKLFIYYPEKNSQGEEFPLGNIFSRVNVERNDVEMFGKIDVVSIELKEYFNEDCGTLLASIDFEKETFKEVDKK